MVKDIGKVVKNFSEEKQEEFNEQLNEALNDEHSYFMMGGTDYVHVPQRDLHRIKKNVYRSVFFGSKNFETWSGNGYVDSFKSQEVPQYPLNTYESETV